MLGKLLLLFTVIPTIELIILVGIGQLIGFWPTVALIVITGTLGAILAKIAGLSIVSQIIGDLKNGILPGRKLVDGVLILIAGVMLITPGILTDATGLLLLFPVTRTFFREKAIRWLKRKLLKGSLDVNFFKW
jgi:UPF0716 protein FxsA